MQLIPTPTNVEFKKETDYRGDFIIEPLYPGYGLTIGNALRRVLLSSIPGAAITSIKIKGVDHEFSTLPYVKEDIVDILLNIKQVDLKIEGEDVGTPEEPLKITLKKTGEGKITAGDFDCPSQVTIANNNLHLATLTDKAASFEAECIVAKGMGYIPTENRPAGALDIGHIAVDAIYAPINHVSFRTENVRVGEMTNWDKLILTVETNGTVTCQDAFDLSVHILKDQFGSLITEPSAEPGKKSAAEPVLEEAEEETDDEEDEDSSDEEKSKKKRGRPKKDSK